MSSWSISEFFLKKREKTLDEQGKVFIFFNFKG